MPGFEVKPKGLGSLFPQMRRASSCREAAEMNEALISSPFRETMSASRGAPLNTYTP